jgi:hypothetical protein
VHRGGATGDPLPEEWLTPRRALLDALEAGQPVTLQRRNLHRHMNLRRDQ